MDRDGGIKHICIKHITIFERYSSGESVKQFQIGDVIWIYGIIREEGEDTYIIYKDEDCDSNGYIKITINSDFWDINTKQMESFMDYREYIINQILE
jgi:predicted DNA binding protein